MVGLGLTSDKSWLSEPQSVSPSVRGSLRLPRGLLGRQNSIWARIWYTVGTLMQACGAVLRYLRLGHSPLSWPVASGWKGQWPCVLSRGKLVTRIKRLLKLVPC